MNDNIDVIKEIVSKYTGISQGELNEETKIPQAQRDEIIMEVSIATGVAFHFHETNGLTIGKLGQAVDKALG